MSCSPQLLTSNGDYDLHRCASEKRAARVSEKQITLLHKLTRLGFVRGNQMVLYGYRFELVSNPIVVHDSFVFIDAIETKSQRLRRVRVPLPILKMANAERQAA